jgi:hypothetical protein
MVQYGQSIPAIWALNSLKGIAKKFNLKLNTVDGIRECARWAAKLN